MKITGTVITFNEENTIAEAGITHRGPTKSLWLILKAQIASFVPAEEARIAF